MGGNRFHLAFGRLAAGPPLPRLCALIERQHYASLRAYRQKSVFLAMFSGVAKLKSPTSLHIFSATID